MTDPEKASSSGHKIARYGYVGLGLLAGLAIGLGVFTFGYAKGTSYFGNNPASCANCHVMRDQFEGWQRSSHRAAATCNDCHTPPGFVGKYQTKMLNGVFHSWAFTTGYFPDQIRITERNHKVTGQACLKCHEDVVFGIRGIRLHGEDLDCVRCHHSVGHPH